MKRKIIRLKSKSKRAQGFMQSNPAASPDEIAIRFSLSKQAVYGLRSKMKKEGFVFPKKSEQMPTLAPAAPMPYLSQKLEQLGIDPVEYAQAVEGLQKTKEQLGIVDTTLDARAVDYGLFLEGAEVMQMLKRVVQNALSNRDKVLAHDQAEAMDMIIHKIGRIINGNPDVVDHWLDIAGYAQLVADRLEGRIR
jgi:hypothetical protein